MTEHHEANTSMSRLFSACWRDGELKARLIADPISVLAEFGLNVPEGMDVKVVENTDNCIHITLPSNPSADAEISDEELAAAAGGDAGDVISCILGYGMLTAC